MRSYGAKPPAEPELAVEIPIETKRRLGLDEQQSWIIVTDANRFAIADQLERDSCGARDR